MPSAAEALRYGAEIASVEQLGPFDVPGLTPRLVRVHRPPSFVPGPAPVVVLFDGQNVFDDTPSFAGGWHLHDTAPRLATRRRPAPVVIGIDHGGVERIHELCPYPGPRTRGLLNPLLDWLTGWLLPWLAGRLGLSAPPAQKRVIGGSSSAASRRCMPIIATRASSVVPCVCLPRSGPVVRLFELVARAPRPPESRIYLDMGRHEGGGMLAGAARMTELLAAKGYSRSALRFREDPRGRHREADWRRRAPAALRFLLSRRAG